MSFEVGDFVYLKVSPMRGFTPFQGTRQARTEVHWTIQDLGGEVK
jgi:hypothetical protein